SLQMSTSSSRIGSEGPQALRTDRQTGDGTAPLQGVLDRIRDACSRTIDSAFSGPSEAEGIERAGNVFGDQHLDPGRFPHSGHEATRKRCRQGIAGFGIRELLVQGPSDALKATADELTLNQLRVDGATDLLSHHVALDRHRAGLAVDGHERDMYAVRER